MDWQALSLSLRLSAWTVAVLLPIGILIARALAFREFRGKSLIEALIAFPLVLPPTVLGYYLLVSLGGASALGRFHEWAFGGTLVFSFEGLLIASIIANLPFAVQPMQLSFGAIPRDVREAAWCSGLSRRTTFWRIELPLAWPGLLAAFALTFAHTLGEFGVVLMVGGNIPGETRTLSVAIYDRVQAFDSQAADIMAAVLLLLAMTAIAIVYGLARRRPNHG
ncbi:MAG: molybdate ABC transporter permease subunit [Alphaproteobacteria bacterium]